MLRDSRASVPRAALLVLAGCCLLSGAALATTPTFDFESGDLQGWRIAEGSFGMIVCDRATFRNTGETYNKQGQYYLCSLETPEYTSGDPYTGFVRSPSFTVSEPLMSFLVGGGAGEGVYMGLCLAEGDRLVRTARGQNTETLFRHIWDVREFAGREAYLVMVDRETGGWGHVTFDDFRRPTEEEAASIPADSEAPDLLSPLLARAAALRAGLEDLHATYGAAYPGYAEYRRELSRLEDALASTPGYATLTTGLDALARRALLAHPLLTGREILYIRRAQYVPDHHNTETMFQTGEINTASFRGGGALMALDLAAGVTRTVLALPEGMVRDPDVSWDASRVLVSLRDDIADDYHIAEVPADGSPPMRLTSGSGITDIDPLYLPDGRIVFTSTREPKYCGCNRHIMGNLFRMEGDGSDILQIGKSTLHEGHGALLPDGRVLYDRWEYVDRNFGDAQGLWTCNPDGTQHAIFWGNNTPSPGAVIDAQPVPGEPGRFIAVFGSCHDRPWGALALVDRNLGIDGKEPVVRTWPESAMEHVMRGGIDEFTAVNPKYEDPYSVDARRFLCSRMTGNGEEMGIYLVDTFGNEVLVHADPPGCFDPMLLAPRPPVATVPDRVALSRDVGRIYITDVYQGTGMEHVARGSVAALRVVEVPEKRFWSSQAWPGQGVEAPAMAWNDFNAKRILGTAPVEPDGSAYVEVPADSFVYFQLLDGHGAMVQSMRSGTIIRPGEMLGCGGCHESRRESLPNRDTQAFHRGASRLEPWYGSTRDFSYAAEVQPVWDRYCVSCHDYGTNGGARLNLSGDRVLAFNVSYDELWRKGYLRVVGAGPAEVQPPLSWGSRVSPLVEILHAGHYGVELDAESWDRVNTWIDLNAPYYPSYATGFPDNLYGRSPLTPEETARLEQLTGKQIASAGLISDPDPWVNFTRPELSPILGGVGATTRDEALAVIRAGATRLAAEPRPDMPGWALSGADAARDAKYRAWASAQALVREALAAGGRHRAPTRASELR